MRVNLHKPNRNLWMVSLAAFLVGFIASILTIPILSPIAFYLVALAAALLLLGTWIF